MSSVRGRQTESPLTGERVESCGSAAWGGPSLGASGAVGWQASAGVAQEGRDRYAYVGGRNGGLSGATQSLAATYSGQTHVVSPWHPK